MDSYGTNVLTWRLFSASPMKAAIHLGPDFLLKSGICKNTYFRKFWGEFNISQKLIKEHSEEILIVESFGCVHANSVSRVGQVKDISGATERWKGQVGDLKKYSSHQDPLGLDGEPIEFEKKFPRFRHYHFFARSRTTWRQRTSNQKTSKTGSSSCQCSLTLHGRRMMRNVFRMPKKPRITPWSSYQDIGRFWVQHRKRSGMAIPTI